jgi:ubiquitin carboxyl-terminal hydrolase 14
MSSFALNWGKKDFQVMIDDATTPASLMKQVEDLTGVTVANQKLIAKKGWKGVLSEKTKLKVKPGKTTISLMGTATATITATTSGATTVQFVEDMTKTDALKATNANPPGLVNLGNTCYMNSTLQCLRMIPEIRAALNCSDTIQSSSLEVKFTQDLNRLFNETDNTFAPDAVTPHQFVNTLRRSFPTFNQRGDRGGFLQQDAEEFYGTVMRCLGNSLTRNQLSGSIDKLKDAFGQRDGLPRCESLIDSLFKIEFETKETCVESEEVVTRKSEDSKLTCNIVGGGGSDQKVDHLHQGLELSLTGEVEKMSTKLGRNAVWKRETKISRLPRYICLQYMRFYWKKRTPTAMDPSVGTNCKMKRRVQFSDTLDMFNFCSTDLQKILKVARDASIDLKSHEKNDDSSATKSAATKGETKEDTPTPMEIDEGDDASDLAAALAMSTNTGKFAGYGLPSNFQGQYEIFAVVTHIGRSANSGHYMGWVRTAPGSDDWLRFNDNEVDECKFIDIKELDGGTGDNDMVYLALYRQSK